MNIIFRMKSHKINEGLEMRFHDILALAGLCGVCVGLLLFATMAGFRWVGAAIALCSLVLLAYGASFL